MFSGAASTIATKVDSAFLFILVICVLMLVLITFLMVFFVIKYRRDKNPIPTNIEGNFLLEVVWTVVPTILVIAMFYYGWIGYREMVTIPEDAMAVKVTAQMWSWSFEYENGTQSNELAVPINKPVKLELFSRDVLHSFYVPAFRVKKDVVPGIRNTLWFTADEEGTYDVLCAEYCGLRHSAMLSQVVVMAQDQFASWMAGKVAPEAAQPAGRELMESSGCLGCHSLDGSRIVGPTLKGIFGRKGRVVTDGAERDVVVDEDYLRRSMLKPNSDVVVGYPPIMPSQEEILSDEQIDAIIKYLKTLQ
jgi:cytochrome c oxidase subunit 2